MPSRWAAAEELRELAAVDDLAFTIDQGEVFALVGPKGAGKSTTVDILEGHRRRDGRYGRGAGLPPRDRRPGAANGSASSCRRLRRRHGLRGGPALGRAHHQIRPSVRRRAWDLVEGLRDLGKTVLLTATSVIMFVRGRMETANEHDQGMSAESSLMTVASVAGLLIDATRNPTRSRRSCVASTS